ncbi:MAG: family 20 glycosylhydrolase [Marinilabiliales bacterium]
MKYLLLIIFLSFFIIHGCINHGNNTFKTSDINIVPKPVEIIKSEGYFTINDKTKILYDKNDTNLLKLATYFQKLFKKKCNYKLLIENYNSSKSYKNCIIIKRKSSTDSLGNEGYNLQITKDKIIISAQNYAGIFYAFQSLRQLLPPEFENNQIYENARWELPCLTIKDYPRFSHRGLLLDCCRHFIEKDFIKRYIDLLAYYKMNVLHWHLTEDQGWRIEIRKYPKLTEIGAWRTLADGSIYGGYYTQDDIKEIVKYAESRFVKIIPEIEMPGHSVAALASYPQFSCTGGPFKVETNWGVFKDIYCAGNDSTFIFLENILDEVIELFPSEYIHIGGDEAPKYRWEHCNKCQKRIQDENLKDEHELQTWFISKISQYLKLKGKKLIGWDEILEGGLIPDATVQSWRGMDGAIKAAKTGHDAIVSPTSHCYFDYDVKTTNLEKVYSFEPLPENLNKIEAKHILGGECNMWTEHAPQESIDSKIFPRMLAISEVLWTPKYNKDFKDFHKRIEKQYEYLDAMGIKYGFEKVPVEFIVNYNNGFEVTLNKAQDNIELYYTIDNDTVNEKKTEYLTPIKLTQGTIKVVAYQNDKPVGKSFIRSFVNNKAIGKSVIYINKYSENYPGSGNNNLIDGCRGTQDFRDNLWQGFRFDNMEVIIDLGALSEFSKLSAGFLQSTPSWIFMPEEVEFFISDNGKNYLSAGKVINDISANDNTLIIKDFSVELDMTKAQYIKVIARNRHYCPDWHPGAGGEAWLFCDEIIVQ